MPNNEDELKTRLKLMLYSVKNRYRVAREIIYDMYPEDWRPERIELLRRISVAEQKETVQLLIEGLYDLE